MTVVSKSVLKSYFTPGAKPKSSQFGDFVDSIRHIGEKIPGADIEGYDGFIVGTMNATLTTLPSEFPKVETWNVHQEGTYTNFGSIVVTSNPDWEEDEDKGDLEKGLVQFRKVGSAWSKVIIPLSNFQLSTEQVMVDIFPSRSADVSNSIFSFSTGASTTVSGGLRTAKIPLVPGRKYRLEGWLGVKTFILVSPLGATVAKYRMGTGDPDNITMPWEFVCPEGVNGFGANLKQDASDTETYENLANLRIYEYASETTAIKVNGYNMASINHVPISYAALKANYTLLPEGRYTVYGLGAHVFDISISKSNYSKSIHLYGGDYDYYRLDMDNNKILAYDEVACVVRNTTGIWDFINDSGHVPKGFASIDNTNPDALIVNMTKTYTKVQSLVCNPDETYAEQGLFVGASVGLGKITCYMTVNNSVGYITGASGVLNVSSAGFGTPIKSQSFNSSTGDVTVTTSTTKNVIDYIVSLNADYRVVEVSSTSTNSVFRLYHVLTNEILKDITKINIKYCKIGNRRISNADVKLSGSNIWIHGLMMTELS